MLWPLLVEYTEPGVPMIAHAQQQGNMALFLTLFILTCVEVLIVKVAQSEREIENLLTPHDPPFSVEDADDEEDDCKLRLSLEEEAIKSRRGDSFSVEGLCTNCNGSSGIDEHVETRSSNGSVTTGSGSKIRNRSSRKTSSASCDENDGLSLPQTEASNDANTVRIREQIEKLVEKIVGGSLDGVSVGKLSKNACYLAMFVKHHDSLCQGLARLGFALHFTLFNENGFEQDSPRAAFSALKSSIQKIISEAIKLPRISEILQAPDTAEELENDTDFSNKSYEDILATAILNKIIEQSQKRQDRSKARKSRRSRMKSMETENNDDEENELMYNSDWSDTSRSEQLSLTIEEHIEEITTAYENSDEEVNEEINLNSAIPFPESGRTIWNGENSEGEGQEHSSATEIVTSSNSWEENWLFQRKRLRSRPNAHHPVPVPMLVPNPSQDFRALIGGVDADDLSDMSECSDSALEDVVLAGNDEEQIVQEADSELVNGNLKFEEAEDVGSPPSLNSESSCPSLSQKERDVSIDYEYFQKMDIELKDRSLSRPRNLDLPNSAAGDIAEPLKCQIAEREKEKWNNPVPLPDNPYSPENIKKREQRKKMEYFRTGCHTETSVEFPSDSLQGITKEPCREIYSRDYYVKASRCPTGDPNMRTSPTIPIHPFVETGVENPSLGENLHEEEFDTPPRRERSLREQIAEKTNIMLPNVKELTKKFAKGIDEFNPRTKQNNLISDLKRERAPSVKSLCGREGDCGNSSDTVTSGGVELKLSPKCSTISRSSAAGLGCVDEPGRGENADRDEILDGVKEIAKSSSAVSKLAGKEVHSLTARSISKEFREELKSNSSRRALPKVDRGSSGESDQCEIASESTRNRSPTPPIDLQSKRKFWEDIISNSQK